MWFLGWHVSDGCCYYDKKRNSYTISFCLHQKDKSILYHISNIFYKDGNSGAADYFLPRKYERYLDLCKYMYKGIMPEKLTYNAFKAPHSDDNIIEAAE